MRTCQLCGIHAGVAARTFPVEYKDGDEVEFERVDMCLLCSRLKRDQLREKFSKSDCTTLLRDFFAGCALAGMKGNADRNMTDKEAALFAYYAADAMLEERGI